MRTRGQVPTKFCEKQLRGKKSEDQQKVSVADAPNLAGTEDGTWQNYEYERYLPRR